MSAPAPESTESTLRALIAQNRQLQESLVHQIEALAKHKEENAILQRNMRQLRKHLQFKEHVAQGLEVVWNKARLACLHCGGLSSISIAFK